MRQSLAKSIVSLFPSGRRFLATFHDLQVAVRQLQEERSVVPTVASTAPPAPARTNILIG